MTKVPHIDFRKNTQHVAPRLVAATQKSTRTAVTKRAQAVETFGEEKFEALRQAGHDIKLHAITHLDEYLPMIEERVTQAGGIVHWARDDEEARRIVLEIAAQHNAKRVVKVKSMATEEIELNHALKDAGIEAFETDLGEYIVQLAGQRPSHPTAPALHMTKEDIAELFRNKLGVDAPPVPSDLTEIARNKLRQEFLSADMGISGGNFLIAETGTLVIVTNEGNGRMCTALPPVHVAIVGIEKVIPDWESLAVMLKLLARSGTGQKITAYTNLITPGAEEGPREFHLVLLDNGRSRILQDEIARETLLCIRCGACANICPVYNNVGGFAYGWVQLGPIGAILSPQLLGTKIAGDLPFASSLCGACADVCPVKIPIPKILLHLRHRVAEGDRFEGAIVSKSVGVVGSVGATTLSAPWLYRIGGRMLQAIQLPFRRGDWLTKLPPPFNRWTRVRPFPAVKNDFRWWWKNIGRR
ncbi:MAG: iron-sulfur cluster-binding protein [Chloroflexi bacterium]|nr:iron-sulfur cluster-binding protein [Chloroflexota bacterium]